MPHNTWKYLQSLPMPPKHYKGNKPIYNYKHLTVYTNVECHSVRDMELPMNAITLKKKTLGLGIEFGFVRSLSKSCWALLVNCS